MKFLLFIFLYYFYRMYYFEEYCRILQLQHYQNDRFLEYVVNQKKEKGYYWISFLKVIPFLFLHKDMSLLFLLLFAYLCIVYKRKKEIKVVYTKRMIRFYVCMFFLYTFILFTSYKTNTLAYMLLLLQFLDKEIVLLSGYITTPLEKGIRSFYVYLAQRKLKANVSLLKIGIVGSYGKTSTKNILYDLLKDKYLCLKSKGSYNNLMGNSLTIRKELKSIHELFISEMGSDHKGEIVQLLKFIQPSYVIITSIGNQHLNTFKTQEAIVQEKLSPLFFLKKSDTAILNIDNPYIYNNKDKGVCNKITFGENKEADYRVENIKMYSYGSSFTICFKEHSYDFEIKLLGYYNIMNVVGALVLAHTLNVDMEYMIKICRNLKPVKHRLYPIYKKNYICIDNAFNSNIYSFKNSMDLLKRMNQYKVLLTPGLIDVKEDAKINEEIMKYAAKVCDEIVVVGKRNKDALLKGLTKNGFNNYLCIDTMEEALIYIDTIDKKDYVVLIENDIDKVLMNMQ